MDFIAEYLSTRTISGKIFSDIPQNNTRLIVIIPAYDEAGISCTLDSLKNCDKPPCAVEVMVLVNAPYGAGEEQLQQNNKTMGELQSWNKQNRDSFFKLLFYNAGARKEPGWGVGMGALLLRRQL